MNGEKFKWQDFTTSEGLPIKYRMKQKRNGEKAHVFRFKNPFFNSDTGAALDSGGLVLPQDGEDRGTMNGECVGGILGLAK